METFLKKYLYVHRIDIYCVINNFFFKSKYLSVLVVDEIFVYYKHYIYYKITFFMHDVNILRLHILLHLRIYL